MHNTPQGKLVARTIPVVVILFSIAVSILVYPSYQANAVFGSGSADLSTEDVQIHKENQSKATSSPAPGSSSPSTKPTPTTSTSTRPSTPQPSQAVDSPSTPSTSEKSMTSNDSNPGWTSWLLGGATVLLVVLISGFVWSMKRKK